VFAYYRRSQNLPCQSINWGALEVDMVGNNASIKAQLKRMGHNPLDKTMIKLSLTDSLIHNQTQVIYASIDNAKSGITTQKQKPLINGIKGKLKVQEDVALMFNQIEFNKTTEDEKVE